MVIWGVTTAPLAQNINVKLSKNRASAKGARRNLSEPVMIVLFRDSRNVVLNNSADSLIVCRLIAALAIPMEKYMIKAEEERKLIEVQAAISKGEMKKLGWEQTSRNTEYHSSNREEKTIRHVGSFYFLYNVHLLIQDCH